MFGESGQMGKGMFPERIDGEEPVDFMGKFPVNKVGL
jgi:hypothetical protein